MRYSIEPRDMDMDMDFYLSRKNMGKNVSNKYSQKLLNSDKKSTTDTIKTASKKSILKTIEATGDLIGNITADQITSISKTAASSQNKDANNETKTTKKDTYIQIKDNKLVMN